MDQLEPDNSMEPKEDVEPDSDIIHIIIPQSPRNPALGTRKSSRNLKKQEQGPSYTEPVAAQVLPAKKKKNKKKKNKKKKKSKLKLAIKPTEDPTHIKINDETDWQELLRQIRNSDVNLQDLQTLEIHLDAANLSEYADSMLAVALTEFRPLPDGTNPHNLQLIQLVMKGRILFTRQSYHLVSPVLSDFVGDNLERLVEGKLSKEEKKRLPYRINTTTRTLAEALLGIRGVKEVSIEGKGHMEADFAATIKATLIQDPGTSIVEASDSESQFSTHRFNKLGTVSSEAYTAKAHHPYPTVPGTLNYDFSRLKAKERFLVDEKIELAARLSGFSDQDAQAAAVVAKGGPGSNKLRPTYEVGPTLKAQEQAQEQARENMDKKQEQELEDEGTEKDIKEEDDSLGLMKMTTMNKTKALDGEEMAELGWRV